MKRVLGSVVVALSVAVLAAAPARTASGVGDASSKPAAAGAAKLYRRESLGPGQRLVSQYGRYRLELGADRKLVLSGPLGTIWSLTGVTRLGMDNDGYLRAYGIRNTPVWSQGGGKALQLALSANGRLELEGPGQTWAVPTTERWVYLASAVNGNRVALGTQQQGFQAFENETLAATASPPRFSSNEPFILFGDCAVKCAMMPRKWWANPNGSYVSAVAKWPPPSSNSGPRDGQLVVTLTRTVGPRETFQFVGNCATGCGIKSLATGRFASAEFGYLGTYSGILVARATSVSGWERFTVVPM